MQSTQSVLDRVNIAALPRGPTKSWRETGEAAALVAGLYPDRRRTYAPREIIYREGETVGSLLQVRDGLVKLESYLPGGRARIVRLCGDGDLLGVEGMLDQVFRHTAVAVARTVVDSTRINVIKRAERHSPRRITDILRLAVNQLIRSDRWLADFSTGSIRSRVARLVDYLSAFVYGEEAVQVRLLSVSDMADILGVSAEGVSRVIAEFKRQGILNRHDETQPGVFDVDFPRLHREAIE